MYTIKEASARSGVGIPLLRAWERRYGVVSPTRTASGYRLYDEDAIARLVAMRRLIGAGWAPQQAGVRVREADAATLAELAETPGRTAASEPADVEVPDAARESLVGRIVGAARQLDAAALETALDEAFGSVRFETAWESVLRPALHEIGNAWERGEVSVAGEHATSQAIHRRLAMAFEAAGPAPSDPPVLVGLAPGARHEYGALAFATAARRAGLPVLYLGPDLPVDSWVAAATERQAGAAVVGVPRPADAQRASEVVAALVAQRPETVVLVGGASAARVHADEAVRLESDSLGGLVDDVRRQLAARGRRPRLA